MDEESSLRLQIDYIKQKWLNEQYGMVENDGSDTLAQIRKLKRQLYEFQKNKDLETLKNSSSVTIGKDIETGQPLRLGDIERRSGLYILGKSGMGKSVLLVNIMNQHIEQGRGMFFLDPHGDAITDLLTRGDNRLIDAVRLFNPQDKQYSFGINLLSCRDVNSLTERMDTYTRAYNVFYKLWENEWGPWLQLILQNTLHAFIENQDYTLAEVPMFLNPRNSAFRNHIISNIKHNPAVVDFWRDEFFERRDRDQQERVDAALTRVTTLLTHSYVRDIIGQKTTTIDFSYYLKYNTILLFKLAASLPADIKKFIGTILMSELLHAARNRLEKDRYHYGIFVDEFQNFASSDDFTTLITEARKFGIATTICHVERYGQFAQNQKLLGATLAAVNKVFFQLTVKDAEELAPEFAKEATTTEIRLEPELVISQEPLNDLLRRGHANPRIQELVNSKFRPIQIYIENLRDRIEGAQIDRTDLLSQAAIFQDQASVDRIDERIDELAQRHREGRGIRHDALTDAMVAIDSAMALHTQARDVTEDMKTAFGFYQRVQQKIRNINRFLNALMENRISLEPGQEYYANFFVDVIQASFSLDANHVRVYPLYLALLFGDPKIPRIIPSYLAFKYFWAEMEEAFIQIRIKQYDEWQIKDRIAPKEYWVIRPTDEEYTRSIQSVLASEKKLLRKERVKVENFEPPYILDTEDEEGGLPIYLPDLPPRVLTPNEIDRLKKICYTDLLYSSVTGEKKHEKLIFETELEELCHLLQKPENHIRIPSGQYVEKPVSVRLVSDMTNEMAQELANLPRFTAYAKVVQENNGEQVVIKRLIKTLPIPLLSNQKRDIESRAIANGYSLCKARDLIEKEIRERQEKWRRTGSAPSAEEPRRRRN